VPVHVVTYAEAVRAGGADEEDAVGVFLAGGAGGVGTVHEVLEGAESGAGGEVVVSTNTVISNYLLRPAS